MKNPLLLVVAFFLISFLLTACGSSREVTFSDPEKAKPENPQAPILSEPIPTGLDAMDAAPAECPSGGKIYTVYLDENKNSRIDLLETVISRQVVCNGQPGANGHDGAAGADGHDGSAGADGHSTLFSLTRVTTGLLACSSGSGLQLNSGLDLNRSALLDASEISAVQVVCDGQNGTAGSNGHGLVFETVAAPTNMCPNGGTTLLMALDFMDTGIYTPLAPAQTSMTMCNGVNGANGTDGAAGANGADGATPAYTPVEPILPCGNTVAYKEVLLRLHNGQVLASFSADTGGSMTRLTFIPDGTYMNTDSSNCTFSLATSSDGHTRSISWGGQVQQSWPLP